jgi:hypothetical protein
MPQDVEATADSVQLRDLLFHDGLALASLWPTDLPADDPLMEAARDVSTLPLVGLILKQYLWATGRLRFCNPIPRWATELEGLYPWLPRAVRQHSHDRLLDIAAVAAQDAYARGTASGDDGCWILFNLPPTRLDPSFLNRLLKQDLLYAVFAPAPAPVAASRVRTTRPRRRRAGLRARRRGPPAREPDEPHDLGAAREGERP